MNFDNRYETLQEAAERLYPGQTFDAALPQPWVDALCDRGLDPRSHFVWLYPTGLFCGRAAPVTQRGIEIAATILSFVH